jgi:cytidyltransferase-like protein
MTQVVVSGGFDDLRSPHIRFLQEAARLGALTVALWSDETIRAMTGKAPKFPEAERMYLLDAIRYVSHARLVGGQIELDEVPGLEGFPNRPDVWVVEAEHDTAGKRAFARARGLAYRALSGADLRGFPVAPAPGGPSARKKVVVTGCYDWFHSGHARFFEEVSALGDLYVVVGSDANVRLLKGEGHPLFGQDERRYVVQSARAVTQALISTGRGWMDAEPEIAAIRPDLYAVNEDGDKPEKRAFCAEHGIEYVVLKRAPKAGLPKRQSTELRGF